MQQNISPLPPRLQLPVKQIATAVQALIDLLDCAAPDPEAEDNGDGEEDGTHLDASWVEWTAMRGAAKRGPNFHTGHEDAERDDEDSGDDEAEPNFARLRGSGPGCRISDDDHGGEEAGEVEDAI